MRYYLEKECNILLLLEKEEVVNNITGGNCTCSELRGENSVQLAHTQYAAEFWWMNRGLRGVQKTAETEKS